MGQIASKTAHEVPPSRIAGISLREIKELLQLRRNSSAPCEDAEKSQAKIANIEGKIAMLTKMKEALNELIAACQVNTSLGDCTILEFLEKESGIE